MKKKPLSRPLLFNRPLLRKALVDALRKLNPETLILNPVMFTVGISSVVASLLTVRDAVMQRPYLVGAQITLWLWFTVLFGNLAEALAEGRGKAQADALRKTKTDTKAKKLASIHATEFRLVAATDLRRGDLILAELGDIIPGDGDVVKGIATVDEASITGESAPVIRESGGDRSAVKGGTRIM